MPSPHLPEAGFDPVQSPEPYIDAQIVPRAESHTPSPNPRLSEPHQSPPRPDITCINTPLLPDHDSETGDDSDPELGRFENAGAPPDPKLRELKIAQAFINALKDASLDASGLDSTVIEVLCNPRQSTIAEDLDALDDELNLVLRLSLDIFLAVSNASQDTYTAVRTALAWHTPPINILSYDTIKRRVQELSGVVPLRVDMCINTCVAFTGPFEDLEICPECSESRYTDPEAKSGSRRQFYSIPLGPQLQALRRSPESAEKMQYRAELTAKILQELDDTGLNFPVVYEDVFHGNEYIQAVRDGKITTKDMVLLLSIDGAQLYQSKRSDCWIFIWIIFDHTPDTRYKKKYVLPGGFIGGPNKPKNPDSFLFPSLYHLAALQKEGLKIYNGMTKEVFTSYLFFLFGMADGPGMTYLNGLVGHTGGLGCRMHCDARGRRKPGTSTYFPAALKPINYNVAGCNHGDIDLRADRKPDPTRYQQDLVTVLASPNETKYQANRLKTGIVKPSIFSGLSPTRTFPIPNCFPLDLMHLASLNIPDLFINLWRGTLYCDSSDDKSLWDWVVLVDDVWIKHGKLVADTASYIPGSFDRPPRNPAEKISSGYKAWEFLLYFFVLGPAIFRVVLPDKYWQHYCKLVRGIRILHQKASTAAEIQESHVILVLFVEGFELMYYQRLPSRLHFVRPSIHTLIHCALETTRVGPLCLTTQWPIERVIGDLSGEIRQPSNPFANISERGLRCSQVNALKAMIPELDPTPAPPRGSIDIGNGYRLLRAVDTSARLLPTQEAAALVRFYMTIGVVLPDDYAFKVIKWARLALPVGQVARSAWKEVQTGLNKSGRVPKISRCVKVSDILQAVHSY